jgi:cell division protein FtsW
VARTAQGMKAVTVLFGVTVLALVAFGFVMLTSTSSFTPQRGDAYYFAKRQAVWLGLGLVACAATAFVDYRHYRKWAWPLCLAAAISLIAVLFVGKRINGAVRWLEFGPIRVQPSEFAKYTLVIVLAFWLEQVQHAPKGQPCPRRQHWWWGVWAPLTITGGLAALICLEPDAGTAMLLGAVALLLMWVAGSSSRWLAGLVGSGGAGVTAFLGAILRCDMFQGSFHVQRIIHWWRGDDLHGINHQQFMAMVAFGSGGPWGLGLGNSRQKIAYLPEAHTDFILPIIGEELGLIAVVAVVVAFCVLVVCGIMRVTRAPDLFGLLLGSGILAVVGLQAMINIAVVTNTVPNKGLPLPFISYGGSNLIMTLAAIGVLLNIFRQAQAQDAGTLQESWNG